MWQLLNVAKKDSKNLLSSKRYTKLRGDVEALLSEADTTANREKLEAFWQVGARIEDERLTSRAGYHSSVLRDLAADLGIGTRNLQRAVLFRRVYPRGAPKDLGLSWSHVREVVTIASAAERKRLIAAVHDEDLSSRQLVALIRAGIDTLADSADSTLERPTDASYVFRADVVRVIDGDTVDLCVDLGFETLRNQLVRLYGINTPALGTSEGRAARDFVLRKLVEADTIAIKTERIDLHGRYVAHIFHVPRPVPYLDCFKSGHYLGAQLLEAGHARRAR